MPQVPAKVRRLLEACLQKDPKQRLQSIGDWRLLLTDVQPQAAPAPKSKMPWAVAAALAVALAIAGAGWWRATRPVDHPLMRLSVDLGPDAVAGVNTTAVISPDGKRLVFPARGADGKQQLATRLLEQAMPTLLQGTENARSVLFTRRPMGRFFCRLQSEEDLRPGRRAGHVVRRCDATGRKLGRGRQHHRGAEQHRGSLLAFAKPEERRSR